MGNSPCDLKVISPSPLTIFSYLPKNMDSLTCPALIICKTIFRGIIECEGTKIHIE